MKLGVIIDHSFINGNVYINQPRSNINEDSDNFQYIPYNKFMTQDIDLSVINDNIDTIGIFTHATTFSNRHYTYIQHKNHPNQKGQFNNIPTIDILGELYNKNIKNFFLTSCHAQHILSEIENFPKDMNIFIISNKKSFNSLVLLQDIFFDMYEMHQANNNISAFDIFAKLLCKYPNKMSILHNSKKNIFNQFLDIEINKLSYILPINYIKNTNKKFISPKKAISLISENNNSNINKIHKHIKNNYTKQKIYEFQNNRIQQLEQFINNKILLNDESIYCSRSTSCFNFIKKPKNNIRALKNNFLKHISIFEALNSKYFPIYTALQKKIIKNDLLFQLYIGTLLNSKLTNDNKPILDQAFQILKKHNIKNHDLQKYILSIVFCNRLENLKYIIEKGVDITQDYNFLLQACIQEKAPKENYTELISFILNYYKELLPAKTIHNYLNKHSANCNSLAKTCIVGNIEPIKLLIKHGANINLTIFTDTNKTPHKILHILIKKNNFALSKFLISKYGAKFTDKKESFKMNKDFICLAENILSDNFNNDKLKFIKYLITETDLIEDKISFVKNIITKTVCKNDYIKELTAKDLIYYYSYIQSNHRNINWIADDAAKELLDATEKYKDTYHPKKIIDNNIMYKDLNKLFKTPSVIR